MNAICVHIAERKQLQPTQIQVQLQWDEDLGYSAEVTAEGRSQFLVEASMKEAIERYVLKEFNLRVFREQIELDIDDEMIANVQED